MAGSARTLEIIRSIARRRSGQRKTVLAARPLEPEEEEEEGLVDLVDQFNGVRLRPHLRRSDEDEEDSAVDRVLEGISSPIKVRTNWGQKRHALISAHNDLIKSRRAFSRSALIKTAAAKVGISGTTMGKFFDNLGGQDRAKLLDSTEAFDV